MGILAGIAAHGANGAGTFHVWSLCVLIFILAGCAPRYAAIPSSRSQGIYHVVRPGENLYRIGKAYDVKHGELARVNRMRDAGQIRVGQRIFIPGATRQLPVDVITPAQQESFQSQDTAQQAPYYPSLNQDWGQKFIWPISGSINSGFGPRGSSFHDGIDIGAPEGTPIRAIESGEVIYSDQLRGYGNIVILRHADGFVSVYAHNQDNLVRQGQQVARGETVARVGSTGRVTGPHLHFEIRRDNNAQDPLRYLPQLCCDGASVRVTPGG
ncbi:MAG: LysM peptidoglycan-binding domain-containing M23 family metallopeptidase [Deltaproteobacteria bacterium]|nr:LysM peptidoglycan-binding domain-containing M23 family metallopeptidase [Deltaproteobacteria bacterium]